MLQSVYREFSDKGEIHGGKKKKLQIILVLSFVSLRDLEYSQADNLQFQNGRLWTPLHDL